MKRENVQWKFVIVLKVIAAILITNSHLGKYYPNELLAIGGSFGNSLFFIVSGFCLANISGTFRIWFRKRVSRIYVPVFVATICGIIVQKIEINSMKDVIYYFVYPTNWWFVAAIVVFYILYYYFMNKGDNRYIYFGLVMGVLLYGVVYIFVLDKSQFCVEGNGLAPFKFIYYFLIMLVGGWIGRNRECINCEHTKRSFVILVAAFFMWGMMRVGMIVYPWLLQIQFLTQFFVFIFAVASILWGIGVEQRLQEVISGFIEKIMKRIANMTLEIYMIQFMLLSRLEKIVFPLNIVCAFACIYGCSMVFHFVNNKIGRVTIFRKNAHR